MSQITLGISSCLLGHKVRYNGDHKQSQLCLKKLASLFEYRPFCPEMAAGFGTPRPTMRLVGDPHAPKLVYTDAKHGQDDLSAQLIAGYQDQFAQLEGLDGYILMKNSPSCGMERIKIYQDNGYPHEIKGQGLFAADLIKHYPNLPVEEEGRLNDPKLLENFVMRVYAHHRFRHAVLAQPSFHALLEFHKRYKYILLSHSQPRYRALGTQLSQAHDQPLAQVIDWYFTEFMAILKVIATPKNHSNTLLHILGYLKTKLPSAARQDIVNQIDRYREGHLPLITPIIMLRHYFKQLPDHYILDQYYLWPYPDDLDLHTRI